MATIVKWILTGWGYLYDGITWLPVKIFDNPSKRLRISKKTRAKPIDPNSSILTWRDVEHLDKLTTSLFDDCNTLDDVFERAVREHGDKLSLGTRDILSVEDEKQPSGKVFKKVIGGDYKWLTYDKLLEHVEHFGSGLQAIGQTPRSNICIFAETNAKWMIAAQACFRYNFPVVTLYSTLGDEAIVHGVKESGVSHLILGASLLKVVKPLLKQMPALKHLIYIDEEGSLVDLSGFEGVKLHSMSDVISLGAKKENLAAGRTKPTREDLAVIMYTSGTTGMPKGVMMSHNNMMCAMSGLLARVPGLGPKDIYIGYLPLAHVLELLAELGCISKGASIGYSNPNTLTDKSTMIKEGGKGDATVLKPTLMAAVPLVLDRIYKSVWTTANSGSAIKRAIFDWAYHYKKRTIEKGGRTPLLDKFIFKKIRQALGGNVRMILSGGAPLNEDTQRFINVVFCAPVGQGYGLTETCCAGCVHDVSDLSTGRVGAPVSCCQIRLRDWVEGNYQNSDQPNPRGEVLIGGGNVSMGYYKNPEKTAEDFIEIDGTRWFCTGDIGSIDPDGCLTIIDRKKDLVKLQAGEYVSLGKVETALKLSPIVDNICVYGDSSKTFTVCLVVPNSKAIEPECIKLGLDVSNWSQVCQNKDVGSFVLGALQKQAVQAKLQRFEIPTKVTLVEELWTPESGLVTDALKLKRKNIQMRYSSDINRMYGS